MKEREKPFRNAHLGQLQKHSNKGKIMNINEALNLLNLSGVVSKDDITKAYKKAAMKFHPDRNPAGTEVMKAVNAAYEFLKNLNLDQIEHTDTNNAYNYSEELEAIINELYKLEGIIIEICGNWIWLTGNTKEHKETLKGLGFFWASQKKQWYYRPAEHKSYRHKDGWDMWRIREIFGSVVKNEDKKLISA